MESEMSKDNPKPSQWEYKDEAELIAMAMGTVAGGDVGRLKRFSAVEWYFVPKKPGKNQ